MNQLFAFSTDLNKLVKEKKFAEGLSYFKTNKITFTKDEISKNEYIVSDILTCLRKLSDWNSAYAFINIYNVDVLVNKERILNAYGWLLYANFKADNISEHELHLDEGEIPFEISETDSEEYSFPKSTLHERIEKLIPELVKLNSDFTYTLISSLFKIVLKVERKRPNPNWQFISEFCDLLDPNFLKTDCDTIEIERGGVKKSMELASDRETWFSNKSKALLKLGHYEECKQMCLTALSSFDKFHYSNDIWFEFRIAITKSKLGEIDEAIQSIQKILKRKNEWFINKELSELYAETENWNESLKFALRAIIGFGPIEYKVGLLMLLGLLYDKQGEKKLAFKHYSLARLIRVEQDWSIPSTLNQALDDFDLPEIPIGELKALKYELKNLWMSSSKNSVSPSNQMRNISSDGQEFGIIQKILHNNSKGVTGFIRGANSTSYYFNLHPTDKMCDIIKQGLKVSFKVLPSTKDGKAAKAVNLTTY